MQDNRKRSIDDLFREVMENSEKAPVAGDWEAMKAKLNDSGFVFKKKKRFGWLFLGLSLLSLTLVIGAGVWYYNASTATKNERTVSTLQINVVDNASKESTPITGEQKRSIATREQLQVLMEQENKPQSPMHDGINKLKNSEDNNRTLEKPEIIADNASAKAGEKKILTSSLLPNTKPQFESERKQRREKSKSATTRNKRAKVNSSERDVGMHLSAKELKKSQTEHEVEAMSLTRLPKVFADKDIQESQPPVSHVQERHTHAATNKVGMNMQDESSSSSLGSISVSENETSPNKKNFDPVPASEKVKQQALSSNSITNTDTIETVTTYTMYFSNDSLIRTVFSTDSAETSKSTEEAKEEDTELRFPIFYTGPNFSVDKYYTRVTDKKSYGTSSEHPLKENKIGYSVGWSALVQLNQHLSLEAGLSYAQKYKLEKEYVISTLYLTETYKYHYTGKYIDLSLRGRYYLNPGPLKLYLAIGGAANCNVPEKRDSMGTKGNYFSYRIPYEGRGIIDLQFNSIGITALSGLGIEGNLYPRLRFYIEPTFKYSFTPVIKHATFDNMPVQHYLYSIGIGFGLYYKF